MQWLRGHIFAVDGMGAVFSIVSPLLLLPQLEPWLGLSLAVTWPLAVPAVLLAAVSLRCWRRRAPVHPWLLPVMAGNLGYCVFLPLWLGQHAARVTPLGWGWCALEVVVITSLVAVEAHLWRTRPAATEVR